MQRIVTAAFVIIGDEILSGRTEDKNLSFLAHALGELGVSLREARIVIDGEKEIIEAINSLRKKYDYVFTSGGVGPTHDDITVAAIAKAFSDKLARSEEAVEIMQQYYGEGNLNEARLKMAYLPTKAKLIENDIMSPSGFRIENVFVMAGIPRIFSAIFDGVKKEIVGGRKFKSEEIKTSLLESSIAKDFSNLQHKYPQVLMGSYPSESGTSLVFRSIDYNLLDEASGKMIEILNSTQPNSIVSVTKSQ